MIARAIERAKAPHTIANHENPHRCVVPHPLLNAPSYGLPAWKSDVMHAGSGAPDGVERIHICIASA